MENELMSFEEELAREAQEKASLEESSERIPTISLKSGVLKLGETTFPNNKIAVVIASDVFENTYYTEKYNPDKNSTPVCFAFGRTNEDMAPNPIQVKECQANSCNQCPKNEFGSADTGRGKACSNRRRLVLIPAGEFMKKTNEWELETDPEFYKGAEPAILSVPPTSLVEVAKYIKAVASEYKRPVNAVVTEVSVVPDDRRQFAVKFKVLDKLDKDVYEVIKARGEALVDSAMLPYVYKDDEDLI